MGLRRADDPAAAVEIDDGAIAGAGRRRLMTQEPEPPTRTLDRRPPVAARKRDAAGAFVTRAQILDVAVEPVEFERCARNRPPPYVVNHQRSAARAPSRGQLLVSASPWATFARRA